ncbi:arsenate reductase ArsC [Moraxella atlantae]|uniref:arsenate reductase ArsC n=1 Tax=Faucicola atlantae TaxID=34059 RepID=UPI003750A3C7
MKILYICTHNRCRSILSEAITQQNAQGMIEAKSAGSQPAAEVHPLSLQYLREAGYNTAGLDSKSWDVLADETGADFVPDVVITVCDQAAGESCPLWLGTTPKLHWGLSDPSKLDGRDEEKRQAFFATIREIEGRVEQLVKIAKRPKTEQLAALQQLVQSSSVTNA